MKSSINKNHMVIMIALLMSASAHAGAFGLAVTSVLRHSPAVMRGVRRSMSMAAALKPDPECVKRLLLTSKCPGGKLQGFVYRDETKKLLDEGYILQKELTDLSGADLRGAKLCGEPRDLHREQDEKLLIAKLAGADLSQASLELCDLSCDCSQALMRSTVFHHVYFGRDASFSEADLRGAQFLACGFMGKGDECDKQLFSSAKFSPETNFRDCTFINVNFDGAQNLSAKNFSLGIDEDYDSFISRMKNMIDQHDAQFLLAYAKCLHVRIEREKKRRELEAYNEWAMGGH